MLERQLDELKLTGNLPSPTGVGLSILRLTRQEDYSIGELSRIIQTDPALTGRIIKLANGAMRNGLESVTTTDEAAMRLGVRTVRNLALGFTLVSGNRTGECPSFDYEAYWARSLGAAVCAQALAAELRLALPADAFTCGLLSNVGSLALASIHTDRYSAILEQARGDGPRGLLDLERDGLDLDHRELGGAMLRDWKLPESFAFAVESYELGRVPEEVPSDAAHNMTVLMIAGWRLVTVFLSCRDAAPRQSAGELEAFRKQLDIDPTVFEALCEQALKSWEEWGEILRIPTDSYFDETEILNRAEWNRTHPESLDDDAPAQPRQGLRILAVDDDAVSLRLLEHHLIGDGHAVVKASNGQEALEIALRGDPQMVVTDWNMPEMDGLALCKALRSTPAGRSKYILLLTGREEEERVVEAFDAGANDYVVKPFNPRILLARVRAGQRMIEMREQNELARRARERQVAEMAVLNRKLKAAAMTDVLTRLANRRYAMRRLDQEVAKAGRSGSHLSVIMIDIDHFKVVNDRYGHDIGDQVLRETAAVLKQQTRKGDVVCRHGGEEFLVICAGSTLGMCSATAERIRTAVEENSIDHGLDRSVTVSCGVAALGGGLLTVDELLKEADRRVYTAKARGRNQVCADDPPSESRAAS
jgi:diguanylate cyclase (GGDEF)-like protein